VSKAFTRESDEEQEVVLRPRTPLPPGVKNYITASGAQRLRDELARLESTATTGERGAAREGRIRQLREMIATFVIPEPPIERETVRFGAKVTVNRQANQTETYRLVGVDETNLDRNEISWLSPLAKALLGKRSGDKVPFRSPAGLEQLTVLSVSYDEAV
jgi:transcription elongation factor GreB